MHVYYVYIWSIVNEEFLSETELIWEAMRAFSYLFILASLIWYSKLIHILSENSAEYYSRLLEMSGYAEIYENNTLIEPKGKLFKEDQLHTDRIQDFKVVEDHINEIIREARHEIAILFCNSYTMKMNEIYTILRSLKERANTDILVRILFPKDVDDSLIESYDQVANIRLFERKIEDNNIIIVTDFTRLLVASTIDPVTHNKKTVHLISYFSDERISYAYITTFEKLWLLQTITQLEVK